MNHPLSRPHRTHRSDQGFTLIELLIVIAILAVLAAILIPSYNDAQKRPRDLAALQCGRAIVTAQNVWRAEHGTYTNNLDELGSDVKEVCEEKGIQITTHSAWITDPATSGDKNLSASAGNFAFQVWHPQGSGTYRYWKQGTDRDLAPVSGASLIANPAAHLEAHERQTVHRTTDPGHPRPA